MAMDQEILTMETEMEIIVATKILGSKTAMEMGMLI